MAKGKRTAIAPNIYRYDTTGIYEVEVRVAGCPRQPPKRFAPHTSLAHLTAWMEARRDQLRDELRAFGAMTPSDRRRAVGTLEGDAPEFLRQIAGRSCVKADTSHLRAWFEVVVDGVRLGAMPRSAIVTKHANEAIAQWQTAPSTHAIRRVRVTSYTRTREVQGYDRAAPATSGRVVSALTIRHRCRLLADLYHTLDGKSAPTPIDEAKVPKRGKTPPQTLPADVVATVLANLAKLDKPTFGRFAVAATTGQRPCQIGRARPEDVLLPMRIWLVRDAKGEPGHTVTLDDPQVAAWEAFIAANAWSHEAGGFDTSRYGKLIHAAGWPKTIRPYAARHSIAVDAIRRGVNLGDVQAMLGHADPTTTRIYAPFVVDRQRVVSTTMKDYLSDVFKLRLVKG